MPEKAQQTEPFDKAHDLAERLYALQAAQTNKMMKELEDLSVTLTTMKIDVALVKTYTEGLPARVLALENLRYKTAAFVAFALLVFWGFDHLAPFFKH